jgi:hypothetical protein
MSIQEHLVDVPSNVGTITIIDTSRKNRPEGLRKPYEYILSTQDGKTLYDELNVLLNTQKNICQFAAVTKKSLSLGMRLDVFVLAYTPGLCGEHDECGLTRIQWKELCKGIQEILFKYLGKDARIYADRYTKKDKFQARIEIYIAYSELL